MRNLSKLILLIYRELGKRGWDKTAKGWLNVHTGQYATMQDALQQESDLQHGD